MYFARHNGSRPSFSLVTLQTYGLPSHQGGNDYWSDINRLFFFFWSKLRCDFSQVPWEHTHIFLPTWCVSQQLSHCGTWEANLDVWELGRHSLWKLRVSLTCWEAEPLRIRGGTPQSSHLRSEGSLAKKQPAFVAESTKGSRLLRWLRGKESACQCRRWKRHSFDPWVRKIPWRMKWQSTPVSTLAWEILRTEEPGGLQSTGLQRVRQQKQLSMQHACLQGSELRTGGQKLHHLWRSQPQNAGPFKTEI